MAHDVPVKRGAIYHLRKRVPRRYKAVEQREIVWISLHTDSETVARAKLPTTWQHLIDAWEARLAGDSHDADVRFAAANDLAAARGFRFLRAREVAMLPVEERLARVEAVPLVRGKPDKVAAAAILGGAKDPEITVLRALDLYWSLAADKAFGKSEDQIRRWRNPRKKAIANFVDVVGDKPIADISAEDMLAFRQWWIDRIQLEDLTPNSANKDLIHFADTLKTVNKMKRLGLALPLSELSIKEGERPPRLPFSDDWIRLRLLAPGALDGLNTEARCVLLGMINTGYRPSEATGLLPHHIRLDAEIPHISIEPEGRQLKSPNARRKLALVGVSLEAFKSCPDGFPRYRNRASLSDTIGKFLRENKLVETPTHKLYGLRHAFEDRMLAAGIDERIRRDLMGHKLDRPRYGQGASLQHQQELLQPIAL